MAHVILAFVVAFLFTGLDLITAKYPRTWFLLGRSVALWIYCAIYGLISAAVYVGSHVLIASHKIELGSEVLSSPWVRAAAIGISAKALLHINLFNVSAGSHPFPVGIETFVQPFEPQLLRSVVFDEFNSVRQFVTPFAARYPQINEVQQKIAQNIPPTLPSQEVGAFKDELNKASDSIEAMEKGIRFLGKKTFIRIFP